MLCSIFKFTIYSPAYCSVLCSAIHAQYAHQRIVLHSFLCSALQCTLCSAACTLCLVIGRAVRERPACSLPECNVYSDKVHIKRHYKAKPAVGLLMQPQARLNGLLGKVAPFWWFCPFLYFARYLWLLYLWMVFAMVKWRNQTIKKTPTTKRLTI